MLSGTMNTTQKIPFDFAPDQPLDGKLKATVTKGDATIEETDEELGLHGFIVSGETVEEVEVEWEGDAAQGEPYEAIKERAIITIIAPNATSLGGSIGQPVPKEETTDPDNLPHPDQTLPGDLKPRPERGGRGKR